MTGNYETLSIRRDGRPVRLELARPERLNAVAMTGAPRPSASGWSTTWSAWKPRSRSSRS